MKLRDASRMRSVPSASVSGLSRRHFVGGTLALGTDACVGSREQLRCAVPGDPALASTERAVLVPVEMGGATPFSTAEAPGLPRGNGWGSHGFDAAQSRYNAFERELDATNVSGLSVRWTFEAGSGVTGTPCAVDDRVYFGSWDGRVYALERSTGRQVWAYATGVREYPPARKLGIFASLATRDGKIFVGSDRLRALSAEDGMPLWELVVGDPGRTLEYFWAPPLVVGDRLYAGVSAGSETRTRGRIVCVDARSGHLIWERFTVEEGVAGGALLAAPSFHASSSTLFAATGNPFHERPGPMQHACSLLALDAATGELRWSDQVHPHDVQNLDLNCPPMLVARDGAQADAVVVGGKDGIRLWDLSSRQRVWHVQLTPHLPEGWKEALPTTGPEAGPSAVAGRLVLFASNHHERKGCVLAAIEARTGERRWQVELPAYQFGPMSVAAGVVYQGTVDGKLRAYALNDGRALATLDAGQPVAGGVAVAHGMAFVGTGAGEFLPGNRLVAFGLP